MNGINVSSVRNDTENVTRRAGQIDTDDDSESDEEENRRVSLNSNSKSPRCSSPCLCLTNFFSRISWRCIYRKRTHRLNHGPSNPSFTRRHISSPCWTASQGFCHLRPIRGHVLPRIQPPLHCNREEGLQGLCRAVKGEEGGTTWSSA